MTLKAIYNSSTKVASTFHIRYLIYTYTFWPDVFMKHPPLLKTQSQGPPGPCIVIYFLCPGMTHFCMLETANSTPLRMKINKTL